MGDFTINVVVATGVGVAERWLDRYGRDLGWPSTVTGSSKATHEKLCALGPAPTAEAVDQVIGNSSWTHPHCAVTSHSSPIAVSISDGFSQPLVLADHVIEAAYRRLQEHRAAFQNDGRA